MQAAIPLQVVVNGFPFQPFAGGGAAGAALGFDPRLKPPKGVLLVFCQSVGIFCDDARRRLT